MARPPASPRNASRRNSRNSRPDDSQSVASGSVSGANNGGGNGVGAIRLLQERRKHRPSLGGFGPPDAPVSAEVMNTNYEEWMKLATDNKINATNTWSFALIDYFHDMSLLRNADGTDSINFQKASCTLDGCVKIWTSRVDSVVTETGKLLSGLAEDNTANNAAADDDPDDDDVPESERRVKRKTTRSGQTLVSDFEKLKAAKFELEFTVDPLFKKTSADFDEGGASGILMNHLGCDNGMRVVFDAGDAKLGDEEDQEDNQEEGSDQLIDIAALAEKCFDEYQTPQMIQEMSICPSLSTFKFSGDGVSQPLDLSLLMKSTGQDPEEQHPPDLNGANNSNGNNDPMEEDVFMNGGDHDMIDDGDLYEGGGGTVDFFADQQHFEGTASVGPSGAYDGFVNGLGDSTGSGAGDNQEEYYDATEDALGQPVRTANINEEDVVMMMSGEDNQLFDYFDSRFNKNWAGPEHWKVSRPIYSRIKEEEDKKQQKRKDNKTSKKDKKEFSINFTSASDINSKELFKVGSTSTVLPRLKRKTENINLLPDDYHFSSSQLLRLFLKPKVPLHPRRRGLSRQGPSDNDMEVDEAYWAQQAAAREHGEEDPAAYDWDDNSAPMPFNSEFFHDDDDNDVPEFDEDCLGVEIDVSNGLDSKDVSTAENGDGSSKVPDDLLAATQGQAKRAKPLFVNYAKKAKRVDVKKLKENIWKGLEIENITSLEADSMPDLDDPKNGKHFEEVLQRLKGAYPPDQLSELSTSFCFICLLHLANEQGLKVISEQSIKPEPNPQERVKNINTNNDDDDEDEDEKRVLGGLETLRIFREALMNGNSD